MKYLRQLSVTLLAVYFCTSYALFAQESATLEEVDRLHHQEEHERVIAILEAGLEEVEEGREKAEYLWRLSRAFFNKTSLDLFTGLSEEVAKDQLVKGAEYGHRAVDGCPECAHGYFWQAANMAKRGQLRGMLNSLFAADKVRGLAAKTVERDPDYANSYYLLGRLYRELPGWPLSFGDDDKAVSLGRLSVHLHEQLLSEGSLMNRYNDYYTQLASHLWERNWSSERRLAEQDRRRKAYEQADSRLDEGFNFEGTISLENRSDRREARRILGEAIERLESVEEPNIRERKDLTAAKQTRTEWNN